MKIGLISDTHGLLRPAVFAAFDGVQMILHAGDVGGDDILAELETIAPVHAVVGNTDTFPLASRLPEEQRLQVDGLGIVVVHGHRLGSPAPAKLVREYPEARVIIYGHTHQSLIEWVGPALVVNPGAAGPARFRLTPSVAILETGGDRPEARLVPLSG